MARTPDKDAAGPLAERTGDEAPVATPLDAGGGTRWRGAIPPRWRRPLLGTLTVALVVGVAVGLFVRATGDPRAALGTMLGATPVTGVNIQIASPIATTTSNTFAAVDGVPWGELTISGQPISGAEMAGALFQLSPGQHPLVYTADGFPTLRCVISAPPATSDTCPLANPRAVSDTPQVYGSARLLDLLATPARLNPTARTALDYSIAQTLKLLGGTATINPGDLYLDPRDGTTHQASEALTYSVTPEIATFDEARAHLNALGGQPCGPVCAGWTDPQRAGTSASQSDWRLEVMVRPVSAVNFPDGHSYSNEQVDAREVGPMALLAAHNTGGWQVSPDPQGLPNGAAGGGLSSLLCSQDTQAAVAGLKTLATNIISYRLLPAPNPADGCVVAVLRAPTTACSPECAPLPPLLVIDRFGVMLAANTDAHAAYPSLPLADPIARGIATSAYTDATTPG